MATADESSEHAPDEGAVKRANERTCVGCGKTAPRDDLVRLVLDPRTDTVVVDAKDGSFGRGAHVHAKRECISQAKKGLSRSFKRDVKVDAVELARAIGDAFGRRLEGLLCGGVRAGHVAIGGDMVEEAMRAGKAHLVLIAADGRARAPSDALVFGDKIGLARALGRISAAQREGVAICAVTNMQLATAARRAWLSIQVAPSEDRAAARGENRAPAREGEA